ncbi:helix-turn-helix transcriptional regulator [Paracoccus ravus]|uniref:helix-turn-helix transcriptional regulator n=1 Tax=Paracoccus ravus TaxID=2447760 RepID=UPI00106E44B4|nr:helix-turn-helix domain-containing protein [Paracoccus ravus]
MPQQLRKATDVTLTGADDSWSYMSRRYDDFTAQEQGLDGFEQRYRQIGKGAYQGHIESLRIGGTCLSRERANLAMENEFRFPDNVMCLAFPTSAASQGTGSFGEVVPGRAVMPPSGRDNLFYAGRMMDLVILTLPVDAEIRELCTGHSLVGASFTGWLCTVLDIVRNGYGRAELIRLLPDLIRDHLALLQPESARPGPATQKERAIFDEINQACAMMMPEDMTVTGLAARLDRPRADLRRASLAISGQRLDDLLAARRMNDVYRALRHDKCDRSIGETALDHGFMHGGRFSIAFREMFGIRPKDARRLGRET